MTTLTQRAEQPAAPARTLASPAAAARMETAGGAVLRYGLVAILLYFGAFKFTAVEAEAIRPLVENSPLLSWMYGVFGVRGVSNLIGITEIVAAVLIALRPWRPALSAAGSVAAVGIFAVTVSFLFTTPGAWASVPGFPLPVPGAAGGFLVEDIFLLGAALWSAGEALRAARSRRA
jgi:reactive chlorine resistance protein C